ncbi:MAG: hypothetical protein LQ340_003384, partial [Diploschistes diacapsis]
MASALNRICLTATRTSYRIRPRAAVRPRAQCIRPFHASQIHRADSSSSPPKGAQEPPSALPNSEADPDAADSAARDLEELHHQIDKSSATSADSDLEPLARTEPDSFPESEAAPPSLFSLDEDAADDISLATADEISDEEWQSFLEQPPPNARQAVASYRAAGNAALAEAVRETRKELVMPPRERRRKEKPGFMGMGEDDELDAGDEDETFEGDDMTSLGHGHLEQHREIREYMRIAAWEMPLLT